MYILVFNIELHVHVHHTQGTCIIPTFAIETPNNTYMYMYMQVYTYMCTYMYMYTQ